MSNQNTNVLSSRAMLARVSISQWSARKTDKRITREVITAHNATDDAGRWSKTLVAKNALESIAKAADSARATHTTLTLPWTDNGMRILPAAGYIVYTNRMREHRETFESAVTAFCAAYPSFVEQARRDLNGTFDAADYPEPGEIIARFGFATRIFPVPDASDFRVDLGDADAAAIRADIEQASHEALAGAMRDAWERIAEAVGRMVERLNGYKPSKGKGDKASNTFRDSLVGNVRDLVALLPVLNLTNDPRLADVAARMERDLCQHDADDLREDDNARASTARAAQAILDDVAGFLA